MSDQIERAPVTKDSLPNEETNESLPVIVRRLKDWQKIQVLTLQEVIQAVIRNGRIEDETISQAFDRIKAECEENINRLQRSPESDLVNANISEYRLIIDNLIPLIEHDEAGLQEKLTLHKFLNCVEQAL